VDPSAYATEDTVCGLLTHDQTVEFDLPRTASTVKVTDVRVDCQRTKQGGERWQADYTLWLNVDLVQEWYDIKDDIKDAFELRYVEGQPAAVRESEGGWSCNVAVTLAERKSLQVMIRGSRAEKAACAQAISVAEQMVRNIKG
jgi:hypothetical protein